MGCLEISFSFYFLHLGSLSLCICNFAFYIDQASYFFGCIYLLLYASTSSWGLGLILLLDFSFNVNIYSYSFCKAFYSTESFR